MALADFHYTTGISSGFKVYILEGHPSFEHEQKFHRLPAHRLPVYSVKRKSCTDVRSPDQSSEGQKAAKIQRSAFGPVAVPLAQRASPASIPVAVSCVSTSRPEPTRNSQALHPSCPDKCPLRKPLLNPALSASQLQQMRPSVITCAPRRNCPESPISTSPTISPLRHRNHVAPDSPYSQRPQHTWPTSAPKLPAQFGEDTSPEQLTEKASKNSQPNP